MFGQTNRTEPLTESIENPAVTSKHADPIIAEWTGFCPICQRGTTFRAHNEWFRDHLFCMSCNSIPRERAVMLVLNSELPRWRSLRIHESSPVDRGTSRKLKQE